MHWIIFFLITVIACTVNCEYRSANSDNNTVFMTKNDYRKYRGFTTNSRRSRFLSLFTYVQFDNAKCSGTSGETGRCVVSSECSRKGGTASGPCAGGYGVCCLFMATCGSTIRENGTAFVNSGYPDPYDGTGTCQVTLMKMSSNVCQYRLDFDQLNIMGPEPANHICNNDQFIVSGGNPSVPTICGNSDGNHMYVHVGEGMNTNPVTLSVVTSGPSFERNWRITVTQIPCFTSYQAAEGCLQYFTGVSGQVKSFNFNLSDGRQLSNQDYGICFRGERNFCGIQYTQCADEVNSRTQSFTLSGNSNQAVQAMVGSTGSTNVCSADYLIVPMATNVGRPVAPGRSSSVDRICGGVFSGDVTLFSTTVQSTVRPFILWFHTDNVESPIDVDNKGFCLNYVQQPCTNKI